MKQLKTVNRIFDRSHCDEHQMMLAAGQPRRRKGGEARRQCKPPMVRGHCGNEALGSGQHGRRDHRRNCQAARVEGRPRSSCANLMNLSLTLSLSLHHHTSLHYCQPSCQSLPRDHPKSSPPLTPPLQSTTTAIMHRTYSMRQSRAPTASQIQNPPPPSSSTKSSRFFGKGNLGISTQLC